MKKSYICNTLNLLIRINNMKALPQNAILATTDARSHYSDIKHNEEFYASQQENKITLTEVITTLMQHVLTLNNGRHLKGCTMCCRPFIRNHLYKPI